MARSVCTTSPTLQLTSVTTPRLNQPPNLLPKHLQNLVWLVDLAICQVMVMVWKVVVWEADLVICQVEVMVWKVVVWVTDLMILATEVAWKEMSQVEVMVWKTVAL